MVKSSRKTYSSIKWAVGLIVFTVILVLGGSWLISIQLKPKISSELRSLILKSTDSLYHVEFSDVRTNILTGNAVFVNVKIIPDARILQKLILLKKAPNNSYNIQLKRVVIEGFHPFKLWSAGRLNIDLMLFDRPTIVMSNKQLDFNDNKPPRPSKSPYQYIQAHLKELRVATIAFRDIRFTYVNNNLPVPEADEVDKLNITLSDWLIDPNSARDETRFYLLKDISLNLSDYQYATPDSLYRVHINELNFGASSGKISIRQFSLMPRYGEMEFGKRAAQVKERYNIQMSNLNLDGVDFPLYVSKQELFSKEMNISNGFVAVFNNNGLPKSNSSKSGKYPHQLFQSVKALVTIQQVRAENINLSYAEFDKRTEQRGVITFDNTSGTFTNVTNAAKYKNLNPIMEASLTSYLMGRGKLAVNFKFDLQAKDAAFSYKGMLTDMNGRSLNKITKPLGMLQIRSGYVNKLDFDIQANDQQATGKLNFAYQDLNVGLLKKVGGRDNLVKLGWMSFLANQMIINSDNPDRHTGHFAAASIHYQRPATASFFSFVWHTLFEGIKYSVGLTAEKKAKISGQIAQFKKNKADRDLRRKLRQRRKLAEGGR